MRSVPALALPLLAALLPAQWHPTAAAPANIDGSAVDIAYSLQNGHTVMFGGLANGVILGNTWTFDGSAWTQRSPSAAPTPRLGHRMVYDVQRGAVVLYGGSPVAVQPSSLTDTWEWNGTNWRSVPTSTNPRSRVSHALAYDVLRSRTILWGGFSGIGFGGTDTWEYDGTDWFQVTTQNIPEGLLEVAMAYDVARGRTILFGGRNFTQTPAGSTWSYDGVDWTQLNPATSPPARQQAGLTYDWQNGRLVLFGGSTSLFAPLGDTWVFDGADWSPADGAEPRPVQRTWSNVAYDLGRQQVVLVGGISHLALGDRTWEYGADASELGSGCPGSSGVPTWQAAPPVLGNPFTATLGVVPPTALGAIAWLGFRSDVSAFGPLPLDLTPIGMTGCTLHAAPELFVPMPVAGQQATLTLQIPNDPGLRGRTFFVTGMSLEPVNPFGAVLSPALRCTFAL
ncbi:MAG: Kelch repeat-containing protein [Planctomycetota bacterium]